MNEKRNQKDESERVDPSVGMGVGGRHGPTPPPPGGGGYLNICTPPEFRAPSVDPRLDDLSEMGLPEVWLRVAKEIGVDAFFAMWRILDAEQSMLADAESLIEVRLRRWRSYQRHFRNRYIELLSAAGTGKQEIRARVAQQLGEETSPSNINRVLKKIGR